MKIFPALPETAANERGAIAGANMAQEGDPVIDMAKSLRNIETLLMHLVSGTEVEDGEVEDESGKPTERGKRRGE